MFDIVFTYLENAIVFEVSKNKWKYLGNDVETIYIYIYIFGCVFRKIIFDIRKKWIVFEYISENMC